MKTAPLRICLLIQFILFTWGLGSELSPPNSEQVAGIIGKMREAYAQVKDYQMETVVRAYQEGKAVKTDRFLYTFKKPNHIRIDMQSPHTGTVLVYPDEHGRVVVKPGGWAGFLKLHLSPESALLKIGVGQRVDQTDMGLLIQNMAHSLTDRRRGEIKVFEQDSRVMVKVLAEDHFLAGILTLYQFFIDEMRWLPMEVKEFTPDGNLKRDVIFRNLRTSIGVPDNYFRINGEIIEHGQSG